MPVSGAQRFTQREAQRVSWNDSLLYCLLCSHKAFAREAVAPSLFSCSPLPHRSDCLKVLFTHLCLPREAHESETVLCRNRYNPQDRRQCAAAHFTGVRSLSVWVAEFLSWVIAVPDSILLLLLPLCWTYLTEVNIACWFVGLNLSINTDVAEDFFVFFNHVCLRSPHGECWCTRESERVGMVPCPHCHAWINVEDEPWL